MLLMLVHIRNRSINTSNKSVEYIYMASNHSSALIRFLSEQLKLFCPTFNSYSLLEFHTVLIGDCTDNRLFLNDFDHDSLFFFV